MKKCQNQRFLLSLCILLAMALVLPIPGRSFSSAQQAVFLQAPYYGTTPVTSIFDHDRNWGRILAQ